MAVSAPSQVRSLAKAVATAFAAANLTEEQRNPPGIDITDLPWACPALVSDLTLDGIPLNDYLDAPVETDATRLYRFWVESTRQLWYEPSRLLKNGVYAALGLAMPKVKLGQRALRFSLPIGAPSQVDHTAAVTLALEVAHTAYLSLPIVNVIETNDDYLVEMADGMRFGVEAGRPLLSTQFEFDARGMVPDLLRSPRGEMTYTCHYDQIAAARSVLHSHPGRFAEFDALDTALQALRYLSLGGHCPELIAQMTIRPTDMMHLREQERLLSLAIETLKEDMPDRARLATVHQILVPTVLSETAFRKFVFASSQFPFALALGKLEEIEDKLRAMYKEKIPTSLQRSI